MLNSSTPSTEISLSTMPVVQTPSQSQLYLASAGAAPAAVVKREGHKACKWPLDGASAPIDHLALEEGRANAYRQTGIPT